MISFFFFFLQMGLFFHSFRLFFFVFLSFEGDAVYMPGVLYESDHWALDKIS